MAQKTVKKAASKKLTLEELVEQADAAKKLIRWTCRPTRICQLP